MNLFIAFLILILFVVLRFALPVCLSIGICRFMNRYVEQETKTPQTT